MVQSQLASSPDAGVLLGDEALDGSGSGDSAVWRQHSEIDDDEDGRGDDDDEASGSGMGPTTTGTVSWQPTVIRLINWRYNSARYNSASSRPNSTVEWFPYAVSSIVLFMFVLEIRSRKIHAWYRSVLLCDNVSNKGEIYFRWIMGINPYCELIMQRMQRQVRNNSRSIFVSSFSNKSYIRAAAQRLNIVGDHAAKGQKYSRWGKIWKRDRNRR